MRSARALTRAVARATAVAATCLVLASCAALSGSNDGTGGRGSDGKLSIATAFYPLQYVAQRVAGDLATVENLTQPGQEPHDLSLTVTQTAELADADLVIHEQGLQPAVDDAVAQNATGEVIDAAQVVDLARDADGRTDPHFWQDPLRMATLGDAVADALADLDPDHAETYTARAQDLRSDLEQLDAAYREGLADCDRDTVVVSHAAFGYLAQYGLVMEPITGLSPGAEPTPADLARLQQLIRDEGITTVFSERLVSPELSQSLADDLGIDTAVLDPIEGLTSQTSGDDYLSLMRANLRALAQANGCT